MGNEHSPVQCVCCLPASCTAHIVRTGTRTQRETIPAYCTHQVRFAPPCVSCLILCCILILNTVELTWFSIVLNKNYITIRSKE